jgi:hypothetical protein
MKFTGTIVALLATANLATAMIGEYTLQPGGTKGRYKCSSESTSPKWKRKSMMAFKKEMRCEEYCDDLTNCTGFFRNSATSQTCLFFTNDNCDQYAVNGTNNAYYWYMKTGETAPTAFPTTPQPTNKPTRTPTAFPTKKPTTAYPTKKPTTGKPTRTPTAFPTKKPTTAFPTKKPTTGKPTRTPTAFPTNKPTTAYPTKKPTTAKPTRTPTAFPTSKPTKEPTDAPTEAPTRQAGVYTMQTGGNKNFFKCASGSKSPLYTTVKKTSFKNDMACEEYCDGIEYPQDAATCTGFFRKGQTTCMFMSTCSKPASDSKTWSALTADEQTGAEALGWTEITWDAELDGTLSSKDEPKSESKSWSGLSKAQKSAAEALGWSSSTWNCVSSGCMPEATNKTTGMTYYLRTGETTPTAFPTTATPTNKPTPKPTPFPTDSPTRQAGVYALQAGGKNGFVQCKSGTGSPLYTPLTMNAFKNDMGCEEYCDGMQYPQMTATCQGFLRKGAKTCMFMATCWVPASESKSWSALTADEQTGAQVLGWTEITWDAELDGTLPSKDEPKSGSKSWSGLSKAQKSAAEVLGWDSSSWNCKSDTCVPVATNKTTGLTYYKRVGESAPTAFPTTGTPTNEPTTAQPTKSPTRPVGVYTQKGTDEKCDGTVAPIKTRNKASLAKCEAWCDNIADCNYLEITTQKCKAYSSACTLVPGTAKFSYYERSDPATAAPTNPPTKEPTKSPTDTRLPTTDPTKPPSTEEPATPEPTPKDPTKPPSATAAPTEDDGLSGGAVGGIAVGAIAGIAIIAVGANFMMKRGEYANDAAVSKAPKEGKKETELTVNMEKTDNMSPTVPAV